MRTIERVDCKILDIVLGDEAVGELGASRIGVLEQELPPDMRAAIKVQRRVLDGWFELVSRHTGRLTMGETHRWRYGRGTRGQTTGLGWSLRKEPRCDIRGDEVPTRPMHSFAAGRIVRQNKENVHRVEQTNIVLATAFEENVRLIKQKDSVPNSRSLNKATPCSAPSPMKAKQ